MSADTIRSDADYDADTTNEFFVAGWDPYVIELAADTRRQRDARATEPEREKL